jgi:IDEAL domain
MVRYGDVVEYEYYGLIKKGFVDEVFERFVYVLAFARKDKQTGKWNYFYQCTKDYQEIKNLKVIETPMTPQDLNFMIDLALSTRDKQWFDELTQRKRGLLGRVIG